MFAIRILNHALYAIVFLVFGITCFAVFVWALNHMMTKDGTYLNIPAGMGALLTTVFFMYCFHCNPDFHLARWKDYTRSQKMVFLVIATAFSGLAVMVALAAVTHVSMQAIHSVITPDTGLTTILQVALAAFAAVVASPFVLRYTLHP